MPAQAFFLPAQEGQRFCLFHAAQGESERGRVLYIHPFAEEMNKSRRMAALQCRALAEAGFAVLQIDLLGCGDSSGDFGDARWQSWVQDVVLASHWLRTHTTQGLNLPAHTSTTSSTHSSAPAPGDGTPGPLWLWGLRAGCLLAVEAAQHLEGRCHFLFWQPPWSGKPLLHQFLRIKAAADLHNGQARGVVEALRRALAAGDAVEIAGYRLCAELAQGLEHATLQAPAGGTPAQRVEWFEVSALEHPRLSPMPADASALWHQPGVQLVRHTVHGPAFWQSSLIEDVPGLLAATTAAVCADVP